MAEYIELINKLRQEAEWEAYLQPLCANETPKLLSEAADAIEDLEFACNRYEKDYKDLCAYLPKWIPVAERLPEEKTYVLILADTIAGKIAEVSLLYKDSAGRNCWTALDEYGKNLFDWQPTHWMPLPEPTEEETC